MKLSERLEAAREALSSMDDFAKMEVSVDPIGPRTVLEDFIEAAAELARRVEWAPVAVAGASPGRFYYAAGSDAVEHGQRVRLVPEDGQGGGE